MAAASLLLAGACIGSEHPTEAAGGADGATEAATDAGSPFALSDAQGYVAQPTAQTLFAVWGADPGDVFAVGSNSVIWAYYQGVWTRSQLPVTGRDLYAVWGSAVDDVYAVGIDNGTNGGVIEHFDGHSWTDDFDAPVPLYGVWGSGTGIKETVLAVGAQGMIYGKHPGLDAGTGGNGWTMVLNVPANPRVDAGDAQSQEPILWGIAGSSVFDFAVPADLDRAFHVTQASNIVSLDPIQDRTVSFRSVFGVPTNPESYFFGTNYFGVIWLNTERPADASPIADNLWQIYEDPSNPANRDLYIYGIWGTGNQFLFTGDQGRIYLLDTSKQAMTRLASPTKYTLYGAWGSSASDVYLVGDEEVILHGALPAP